MSFQSLGLAEALTRAVSEHGYTTPTPIQAQAIPAVLAGRDLVAAAQTGTGKTAGFALPILQRLVRRGPSRRTRRTRMPRALILTPTRELAAQVEASISDLWQARCKLDLARGFRRRRLRRPGGAAASAASTSWWRRRVACSITSARATSTCRRSRSWCSTRPIACSTWGSFPTSSAIVG